MLDRFLKNEGLPQSSVDGHRPDRRARHPPIPYSRLYRYRLFLPAHSWCCILFGGSEKMDYTRSRPPRILAAQRSRLSENSPFRLPFPGHVAGVCWSSFGVGSSVIPDLLRRLTATLIDRQGTLWRRIFQPTGGWRCHRRSPFPAAALIPWLVPIMFIPAGAGQIPGEDKGRAMNTTWSAFQIASVVFASPFLYLRS